jgi:hypothetical protein
LTIADWRLRIADCGAIGTQIRWICAILRIEVLRIANDICGNLDNPRNLRSINHCVNLQSKIANLPVGRQACNPKSFPKN